MKMAKKSVEPVIVKGIPNIHPADELFGLREEINTPPKPLHSRLLNLSSASRP
jgi:hypothetical protein